MSHAVLPLLMAVLPTLGPSSTADTTRICIAPTSVASSVGDATAAANAVTGAFGSFLTGPSLRAQPLQARLASQVREEARQANCPYLLLTTFDHEHKRSGGSVLGRMAAGAAQEGAWQAGQASGTAAGRIAGQAAYGAAGQAASNYAVSVHNKDQLTLRYRLETPDGKVLMEKQEKRKAKQDGEDLLTPMVQQAAEAVVGAIPSAGR